GKFEKRVKRHRPLHGWAISHRLAGGELQISFIFARACWGVDEAPTRHARPALRHHLAVHDDGDRLGSAGQLNLIARHIGEHGFVPAKDAARFRAAPDANSTSTDDFDYCVPDPGDTDVLDVFEDRLVGDVAIAVAVGGPGITAVAIGRLGVTVPGGTLAVSPYFAHLRRRP